MKNDLPTYKVIKDKEYDIYMTTYFIVLQAIYLGESYTDILIDELSDEEIKEYVQDLKDKGYKFHVSGNHHVTIYLT